MTSLERIRNSINDLARESGMREKLLALAQNIGAAAANRLRDHMVEVLIPDVEDLWDDPVDSAATEVKQSEKTESTLESASGTDGEWFQRCETESGGRESFCWRFTYDTSFKHFRKAAGNDRAFTLALTDLSDSENLYTISAGELSDALKDHRVKLIVPAVQGARKRRDELQAQHPKWLIEFGRQTRGSNTPFIQIPLDAVHKRRRPTAEELL